MDSCSFSTYISIFFFVSSFQEGVLSCLNRSIVGILRQLFTKSVLISVHDIQFKFEELIAFHRFMQLYMQCMQTIYLCRRYTFSCRRTFQLLTQRSRHGQRYRTMSSALRWTLEEHSLGPLDPSPFTQAVVRAMRKLYLFSPY